MVVVFLFHDHGATAQWAQMGPYGGTVNALITSGNTVYAGTDKGYSYSTDGGRGWITDNGGLTCSSIQAITKMGTDLFAGTPGGCMYLQGGGASWKQAGLPDEATSCLATTGIYLFAGTGRSWCLHFIGWRQQLDPSQ